MNKSDSIKNLAVAMTKAQSEMGGAHKGANNPFFKSKGATNIIVNFQNQRVNWLNCFLKL